MPNSTTTLQSVIDFARTLPELNPVLAVGGFSQQPALTIANDTLTAMLSPGINWKWNRLVMPVFYTNSYQQDYAANNVNLGWIEHAFVIDYNNTSLPKPLWSIEATRDLEQTSFQSSNVGQVCWLPNDQLVYGTWAANTTYTKINGTPSNPGTAFNQIKDPNGNLWKCLNHFNATVTTGSSQPTWPSTPVFPTATAPSTSPTTVNDGTVVWTAINPKGQGFRVSPLPPQQGLYFEVHVIGQARPTLFTSVTTTLEPVPDDYASYFRQGFVAHAYRHAVTKETRSKFQDEFALWTGSMKEAVTKSIREKEDAGFFPTESLSSNGYSGYVGPANPYGAF